MLADGPRLGEGDIRGIVIPPETLPATSAGQAAGSAAETYDAALARFERDLIERTLAACGGRVTDAARRLGLGRATLYKKMAALGLQSRN